MGVAILTEYGFGQRIHRHDPDALDLQECRRGVGGAIFVAGQSDDSPRAESRARLMAAGSR